MNTLRPRATDTQPLDAADVPIPMVIFTRGLVFHFVNRAAGDEFHLNPARVLGRSWYELFPQSLERRALHDELFTGRRSKLDLDDIALPCHPTRHFSFRFRPIVKHGADIEYVAVIAEDITARVQSEKALRESEERFRTAFEHAAIGKALVDPDGRFTRVNSALCRILGYSADELLRIPWQSLVHPDDLPIDAKFAADAMAGDRPHHEVEHRLVHKLGHAVWVHRSVSLVRDESGQPLYQIAQLQDITARRRLEQAVHELTSTTQQQLERDLHDGLGQELTGLSLLASAFATKAELNGSPLASDALALAQVAKQAIATCRDVVRGVSPLTETQGRLVPGIRRLADRVAALGTHAVSFDAQERAPVSLDWDARDQLFRIVQEALDNAVRHSSAAHIGISIDITSQTILVKVRDDGCGISSTGPARSGFGIRAMRLRAAALRGKLLISRAPRGGTLVKCTCPQSQTGGAAARARF